MTGVIDEILDEVKSVFKTSMLARSEMMQADFRRRLTSLGDDELRDRWRDLMGGWKSLKAPTADQVLGTALESSKTPAGGNLEDQCRLWWAEKEGRENGVERCLKELAETGEWGDAIETRIAVWRLLAFGKAASLAEWQSRVLGLAGSGTGRERALRLIEKSGRKRVPKRDDPREAEARP